MSPRRLTVSHHNRFQHIANFRVTYGTSLGRGPHFERTFIAATYMGDPTVYEHSRLRFRQANYTEILLGRL